MAMLVLNFWGFLSIMCILKNYSKFQAVKFIFLEISHLLANRVELFLFFACVVVCDGLLVCVCLASFPSPLHSGLGLHGNGSIGCTNNNYASREKCKKCGQPKEIAAMPAIAIAGASFPTYSHYFARGHGGLGPKTNAGSLGTGVFQRSLPLNSSWSRADANKLGLQLESTWPVGDPSHVLPYPINHLSQPPKGWRNGDWICQCGFHNYASRAQCKKCSTAMSSAHGLKRLASEDLIQEWDNKRLNAGHMIGQQQPYPRFEEIEVAGTSSDPAAGLHASLSIVGSIAAPNIHAQIPDQAATPTIPGKGAKQWRNGDWMCLSCNNHNYASRAECNRCKAQRSIPNEQVNFV